MAEPKPFALRTKMRRARPAFPILKSVEERALESVWCVDEAERLPITAISARYNWREDVHDGVIRK